MGTPHGRRYVLTICVLFGCINREHTTDAAEGRLTPRRDARTKACVSPCDLRTCESVAAERCTQRGGSIVKDRCDCCPVCRRRRKESDSLDEDKTDAPSMPAACNKIKCSDHKMCVLNIQGIPMCRCPSALYCKRRKRERNRVCGRDNVTYRSRCYMQITECAQNKRIGVNHKGPCARKKRQKGKKTKKKKKKKKAIIARLRRRQQARRQKQRERNIRQRKVDRLKRRGVNLVTKNNRRRRRQRQRQP